MVCSDPAEVLARNKSNSSAGQRRWWRGDHEDYDDGEEDWGGWSWWWRWWRWCHRCLFHPNVLHRTGLPGKNCLLRAVCEVLKVFRVSFFFIKKIVSLSGKQSETFLQVAEAGGLPDQGLAGRALQALLLMEHTGEDDGLVRSMFDPDWWTFIIGSNRSSTGKDPFFINAAQGSHAMHVYKGNSDFPQPGGISCSEDSWATREEGVQGGVLLPLLHLHPHRPCQCHAGGGGQSSHFNGKTRKWGFPNDSLNMKCFVQVSIRRIQA